MAAVVAESPIFQPIRPHPFPPPPAPRLGRSAGGHAAAGAIYPGHHAPGSPPLMHPPAYPRVRIPGAQPADGFRRAPDPGRPAPRRLRWSTPASGTHRTCRPTTSGSRPGGAARRGRDGRRGASRGRAALTTKARAEYCMRAGCVDVRVSAPWKTSFRGVLRGGRRRGAVRSLSRSLCGNSTGGIYASLPGYSFRTPPGTGLRSPRVRVRDLLDAKVAGRQLPPQSSRAAAQRSQQPMPDPVTVRQPTPRVAPPVSLSALNPSTEER
jgi:hypothetical protein